ncbi:hypothetical protein HMPREF9554_00020 [Treponema phagedenis F0421]|nr:hypothetical protein HMPREF9554_00020 [Treponema phagedenis F0421]
MVNCSPLRRVELFFIKFFTFWVRCIKKRIDLLKKRYSSSSAVPPAIYKYSTPAKFKLKPIFCKRQTATPALSS